MGEFLLSCPTTSFRGYSIEICFATSVCDYVAIFCIEVVHHRGGSNQFETPTCRGIQNGYMDELLHPFLE